MPLSISASNPSPIGGIVGEITTAVTSSLISNCYFSGDIHDAAPSGSFSFSSCAMGGIVGRASGDDALVENCWMAGDIISTHPGSPFSGPDLGGIVGIADRITITGCIHMGDIQAVGQSALIGGICGHSSGEITDCQNWGTITYLGLEGKVAGIINNSSSPGPTATRCMNAADISVTDTTEGSDSSRASEVGGLFSYGGTLYDCFNCGDISADGCCMVGGLSGRGPVWPGIAITQDGSPPSIWEETPMGTPIPPRWAAGPGTWRTALDWYVRTTPCPCSPRAMRMTIWSTSAV